MMMIMSQTLNQDELKQAVGQAAADYILPHLEDDSIVGVGTGSTANCFIDALAKHKQCFDGAVASSEASAERLHNHGIPVYDLNSVPVLDFYIDGADEINPALEMIKGGGAALTREKIVAAVAKTVICVADETKLVDTMGTFPLPVEVIPMARSYVARALVALGGDPVYRQGVVTDNGGHILDVHNLRLNGSGIDGTQAVAELESRINQITGVITNGLFAQRPANLLLLGTQKGVQTLKSA